MEMNSLKKRKATKPFVSSRPGGILLVVASN